MGVTITQEELDALWDFADPIASEAAFRAAISSSDDEVSRAILGTQLARALGLQARYDEADRVLERVDAPVPAIRARVALERGPLRNSGGHPADAVGFFENAAAIAEAAGKRNRGRALFDAGELTAALQEFEQAQRDAVEFGTEEQQGWAREAIEEVQEAIDAAADGAD